MATGPDKVIRLETGAALVSKIIRFDSKMVADYLHPRSVNWIKRCFQATY